MEFHPLSELDAKTNQEVLAKARKLYEQERLHLKLRELRGKYGIKQVEMSAFTESKLENRKDMKLSTLIDYLESLGMGIEITALPKDSNTEREILLHI